jgi:archaellum component FlaF (FlaF/FlaG flagellin family)
MAASTSVVIALIFVGILTIGTTAYSSIDYYNDIVKDAKYEQDMLKKAKIQTDMTITNITNSTSRLNLTIRNTGKTTLNASAMNVFIEGMLYDYSLITSGNVWTPRNDINITIQATVSSGDRIKITTENGISDYALVP